MRKHLKALTSITYDLMILMLIVTLLISTPSLRAAEKSLQISKIPGSHDGKVVQADGAGLGRR